MILTSNSNPKVKELKKLMQNKALVFFDNPKLMVEAIASGHEILYIIKKEGKSVNISCSAEIVEVSESIFKTFSTTENSQGVIGVVKLLPKKIQKPTGNFLVLDSLQDPGNVGTLIRSALGANFMDVYLINSVKLSNDKAIRSSMGAIFKVNVYECSLKQFEKEFKNWNLPLYACNMDGENVYLHSPPKQFGITVGNEGNGLSNEIKKLATNFLKIPMQNSLESLNAGVAGSIVMYTLSNKQN